jgi:Zn-dependent protease with chaperone function
MAGLRTRLAVLALLALAACATPGTVPTGMVVQSLPPAQGSPQAAAQNFVAVVDQVAPVAEQVCREQTRGVPCDFRIAIDDRMEPSPNAFQTLDDYGNPVLVFNLALIAGVRNPDELAFVVGHEAAHHILGHIPRQQQSAMTGALVAGAMASLGGADEVAVRQAQDFGAMVGSRTFSQDFELEADALGTQIAFRAGFDPLLGAQFFARLPDPGDRFLGSHPPNAKRMATVQQTMSGLR